MKKSLRLAALVCTAFALVACSNGGNKPAEQTETEKTTVVEPAPEVEETTKEVSPNGLAEDEADFLDSLE